MTMYAVFIVYETLLFFVLFSYYALLCSGKKLYFDVEYIFPIPTLNSELLEDDLCVIAIRFFVFFFPINGMDI